MCLSTLEIIVNYIIVVLLVLGSGTFSGLTVGLASIDRLSLEIDAKTNS